jgi:formylglycine-generating enzyme required for sulfatase activity
MKNAPAPWLLLTLIFGAFAVRANNIQINNVRLTGDNPSEGSVLVTFDLSWENSWRTNIGPANWDAVWLFVKFRANGGEWRHARLHDSGHSGGAGTAATLEPGLLNDKLPFDAASNPAIGIMLYRSALGSGTFSATDVQLRWNYGLQGVTPGTVVEADVFGVEMVLVPGGPFWVGDGVSRGSFRQAANGNPFQVTEAGGVLRAATDACCYEDQIKISGIWVDGDGGVSLNAATETEMNPDFPTGYRGFYCMKYEITQGQYRDFLNTLTRQQQNSRTETEIDVTNVTNRYVMCNNSSIQIRNGLRCDATLPLTGSIELYCDLDGDGIKNEPEDGEWIACNYLSNRDGTAYLDWSGLRPMTELEYEKACRGPNVPVGGEYAWGTAEISSNSLSLSDPGTSQEGIGTGYITSAGNANYGYLIPWPYGQVRVGAFAANSLSTGRVTAGAGYYGVMELSGNLLDLTITVGNYGGRSYFGMHGDGEVTITGNHNVPVWRADWWGFGSRGGDFIVNSAQLSVSDRTSGSDYTDYRSARSGFRGVRGVPVSGAGY